MNRWLRLAERLRRGRPPVGTTPADVVHRENKWRLLRYRSERVRYRTPILLVPSLINRHYVLDLLPGKSFAEHLVAQGFDVFCIDWGTPADEDRYLTFDDVCGRTLARAVRAASRHGARGTCHVLGYCMGGTLAAIHAARFPDRLASLLVLAAPVEFDDEGLLSAWTRSDGFDVDALVDGLGNVPWPLLQASFHMLRPTLNLAKAVTLADRAWDDRFLDGFFALETWGNDNVDFPGECYRTWIRDVYRANALVRGELSLMGRRVRLSDVTCPLLAVTFEHDNIVPHRSASALVERAGSADKQHLHLPGGHVGAVVSSGAKAHLWPTLTAWWAARDV
ncbi:MAG: alpha/beta fold hydrolase [Sandaracinaceae bacterium]|nr:alpha/beta fold hydrolase [Sandaracinaceae bacterium]